MKLTNIGTPMTRRLAVQRCGSFVRAGNTWFTVLAFTAGDGLPPEVLNLCLAEVSLPKEVVQMLTFLQPGDLAEFIWKEVEAESRLVKVRIPRLEVDFLQATSPP